MYSIDDVCVVIVFYNGSFDIIDKVINMKKIISKILIVDNHSDKKYEDIFKCLIKVEGVNVIRNKENMGIAYALNQGLEYASKINKKLLLTMDQDSSITGECIKKLVSSIDVDNGIVSVGPFYGEKEVMNTKNQQVTFLITSGNLVDVESIRKIGGYFTKLFIDCVDVDLSFNLVSHGFRLVKVGGTFMEHKIGEYEKSLLLGVKYLSHNPIRYYYKFRNNIIIYKKYAKVEFNLCLKLFCSLIIEFLKLLFIERNKIQKLHYTKLGIIDGLKEKVY